MSARRILWILTTQWRADFFGHAGRTDVVTPNLDQMVAQGSRAAYAVTPHPFGPFARAAILTGVASPANGVRDYFDPLPAHARTIAHQFNAAGWRTGYWGKWHLAPRDPSAPLVGPAHARVVVPREHRGGFDFWQGFESGFLLNDPWLQGDGIGPPRQFSGYQADVVADQAIAGLAEWHEPWFAVVSLESPHPPYAAPAAGVVAREPGRVVLPGDVPQGGAAEVRARRELAGYHAHVTATDRALGRLIEAVPTDTLIVLTSVHGDMQGSEGLFRKGWPHRASVEVPLLVRGAACPPAGDRPFSLLDLGRWTAREAGLQSDWRAPKTVDISMPSVVDLPDQCDRTWRGRVDRHQTSVVTAHGAPWLTYAH